MNIYKYFIILLVGASLNINAVEEFTALEFTALNGLLGFYESPHLFGISSDEMPGQEGVIPQGIAPSDIFDQTINSPEDSHRDTKVVNITRLHGMSLRSHTRDDKEEDSAEKIVPVLGTMTPVSRKRIKIEEPRSSADSDVRKMPPHNMKTSLRYYQEAVLRMSTTLSRDPKNPHYYLPAVNNLRIVLRKGQIPTPEEQALYNYYFTLKMRGNSSRAKKAIKY